MSLPLPNDIAATLADRDLRSQGAAPDPAEVAAGLRRLLAAVERGQLEAREPAARRLVSRLDVAAGAFEQLARDSRLH